MCSFLFGSLYCSSFLCFTCLLFVSSASAFICFFRVRPPGGLYGLGRCMYKMRVFGDMECIVSIVETSLVFSQNLQQCMCQEYSLFCPPETVEVDYGSCVVYNMMCRRCSLGSPAGMGRSLSGLLAESKNNDVNNFCHVSPGDGR